MPRADRSNSTLRPVTIVLESLNRVDGSASFAFGETKAIASVSGPIQVRLASELPSKALFEVLVRPLSGIPGTESKSLAATLRTLLTPSLVLSQNPRTLIQLVVQSLTPAAPYPNPSLTAAFINASTLALIRAASFPMLGVVCAAAVGRVKSRDTDSSPELLLDPAEQEINACDAVGCVAVMFRSPAPSPKGTDMMDDDTGGYSGETVWTSLQGASLQSDYDKLLRLAKTGATSVYTQMRDRLREQVAGSGANSEPVKKMPKHKGGRVALNVDIEDAMDTT
ncbi:hypothetical protein K439DRAFT_1391979 [Ramaria rubella]|nr:hypothetical protein K439DRAFT_1391979 [Ramaria rubella]